MDGAVAVLLYGCAWWVRALLVDGLGTGGSGWGGPGAWVMVGECVGIITGPTGISACPRALQPVLVNPFRTAVSFCKQITRK